jgi:glycosyltransferase involved in cell wall biosynthesis|tara:strand:+ start:86 stop:964 length:879 start_codon:yes stop_codon:yes gene_type:complete
MKIVIGIPAYNEEKNIASILLRLKNISEYIIVCDDGSSDLTSKIAEKLGAIVVKHTKNLGYGAAIKTIFLKAQEINADALVTFDADGQHRIEDIDKILVPIKNNKADIVIGSRFLNDEQKISKYRKIGIKTITELTNITSGTKITDSQSGFRGYNRKTLENIKLTESGMGISTEILIKAKKSNFKIIEVPIIVSYEGETSTHNSIIHGSSVIISTLKYVAMERPLTFYGIPGLVFLIIGVSFGLWAIQIFAIEGVLITNIALIGMGGVILGTVMMITATILYSIISIARERK